MKTVNDGTREVPDDMPAAEYLKDALDERWNMDTEYVGNAPDMRRCWELQNEIRGAHGIEPLGEAELADACEHFAEEEGSMGCWNAGRDGSSLHRGPHGGETMLAMGIISLVLLGALISLVTGLALTEDAPGLLLLAVPLIFVLVTVALGM